MNEVRNFEEGFKNKLGAFYFKKENIEKSEYMSYAVKKLVDIDCIERINCSNKMNSKSNKFNKFVLKKILILKIKH